MTLICHIDTIKHPFNFTPFTKKKGLKDITITYRRVSEIIFKELVCRKAITEDSHKDHRYDEENCIVLINKGIIVIKNFKNNSCEIISFSREYVERKGTDTLYYDMEAKILCNLCFLVSQLSIKNNGIILHGAGLVRNNQAYIFFAVDDGGKTTLIQQNSRYHILSDDKILFSITDSGTTQADATPFGPLSDGPAPSNIRAFFFIRKSKVHEINRSSNLNLLPSLIYDNSEVIESLPKEIKKNAFSLLHKIAFSAPVFELKTNFGHIDWDYLDKCVETAEQEIAKSGIPLFNELSSCKKSTIAQI